jgi:stage II sporulation protein M
LALIFGIVFGLFPLGTAIVNGYVAGFVANMSVAKKGIFVLWRLFPHGIFELPAVLISIGLGMRLGTILFRKASFKEEIIESARFFILIIVPLLIVAAVIEGILIFLFG